MGTQGGGTGVHTGKMGGTQIGCGGGGQIGTEAFGGGHVPLTRNLLKEHHHQDFSPYLECIVVDNNRGVDNIRVVDMDRK